MLICLNVAGCALSEHRSHPQFEVKINTVRQPVLIPPDVGLLELLPSGLIRQRDDWSAAGSKNLQIALSNYFKDNNITLKPLVIDPAIAQEIAEVQALYRLVHKSMRQQTFKSHASTHAVRRFEYSVGAINTLMSKLDADAMIFVSGYDRVSRAGRKALIDLAIADEGGTILYYSVKVPFRAATCATSPAQSVWCRNCWPAFRGSKDEIYSHTDLCLHPGFRLYHAACRTAK